MLEAIKFGVYISKDDFPIILEQKDNKDDGALVFPARSCFIKKAGYNYCREDLVEKIGVISVYSLDESFNVIFIQSLYSLTCLEVKNIKAETPLKAAQEAMDNHFSSIINTKIKHWDAEHRLAQHNASACVIQ